MQSFTIVGQGVPEIKCLVTFIITLQTQLLCLYPYIAYLQFFALFFVYPYMTYLHFFAFWNLELHQEKQENRENYPYVNIRSSAFSNSSTSDGFLKIEYVTF